ncbi:tyrosine-type recombinase/integrase [Paenibacillus donghaensis]|uniref:Core-binding (CB) domain-containing protein n=1 Tax=Paenibacillus donghaensis TaxID=414771 RepID=A0A2Z2KDG3_9BACL|nr:site-specific integrase [Paenibacillus donghaensis]ASA21835.1 hypothetical protein B9T62_14255 [Paenibacillus donghaensis]
MEAVTNNLVGLQVGSVWEDIQTFIGQFNSKNTQNNYIRSIEHFFMFHANKELSELTASDIHIRNADILKYKALLQKHEAEYTNTSINNNVAAIQSLYSFFEMNEYDVNAAVTRIKPLPDDTESCGALYIHEAEEMAHVIMNTVKGQEKSSLIRLAYTISFRKASLLALTWDDIIRHSSGNYYVVTTIGKGGKKHEMSISNALYEELLKIKEQNYYQRYSDNKIFHLSTRTIQDMMNYLKDKLQISKERNVVFHSFRNVASMFGTLEEAKQHYNHSSIVVTEKSYRHKNKDLSNSISLRIDEKVDFSIFEELTKEQLIHLVSDLDIGTLLSLKKHAEGMIEESNVVNHDF